jgi:hypothetical protein
MPCWPGFSGITFMQNFVKFCGFERWKTTHTHTQSMVISKREKASWRKSRVCVCQWTCFVLRSVNWDTNTIGAHLLRQLSFASLQYLYTSCTGELVATVECWGASSWCRGNASEMKTKQKTFLQATAFVESVTLSNSEIWYTTLFNGKSGLVLSCLRQLWRLSSESLRLRP